VPVLREALAKDSDPGMSGGVVGAEDDETHSWPTPARLDQP
jgi:hypothetical protein